MRETSTRQPGPRQGTSWFSRYAVYARCSCRVAITRSRFCLVPAVRDGFFQPRAKLLVTDFREVRFMLRYRQRSWAIFAIECYKGDEGSVIAADTDLDRPSTTLPVFEDAHCARSGCRLRCVRSPAVERSWFFVTRQNTGERQDEHLLMLDSSVIRSDSRGDHVARVHD